MAGTTYILYHYDPSTPAAVVFITLFAITTLIHIDQAWKTNTWYFIPFIIGGVFETIGYTARAISSTQSPHWSTGPYITQSLLLLLAPPLFAASIYMVLTRLIKLTHGERYSLVSTRWLTTLFVSGDVLSFLAQSAGGVMLARASTPSHLKTGEHIIIGGLAIQMLFMSLFSLVTFVFHRRMMLHPTSRSRHLNVPWRRMLTLLYVASGLISARSGYRIVEYLQGDNGFLMRHEVVLYVFDASAMWIVMWIFNVWHPSLVFGRKGNGRRRRQGTNSGGSSHHSRRSHRHRQSGSYNSRDIETQLEYPRAVHSKRWGDQKH